MNLFADPASQTISLGSADDGGGCKMEEKSLPRFIYNPSRPILNMQDGDAD